MLSRGAPRGNARVPNVARAAGCVCSHEASMHARRTQGALRLHCWLPCTAARARGKQQHEHGAEGGRKPPSVLKVRLFEALCRVQGGGGVRRRRGGQA